MTTPWLTPEQQQAWRAYLRGGRLLLEQLEKDLQHEGVSLSEYEILSMVSEATGQAIRMHALSEIVVQSRSRLTHTAKRLEARGWVTRRPTPADGRGVELCLTPSGQAAVERLAPIHLASVRRHLVDRLSPEALVALGEAMTTIRRGILGPIPEPPEPGTTPVGVDAKEQRH